MKKKYPIIAASVAATVMIIRELLYRESLKLVIHRDGIKVPAYNKKRSKYLQEKGDGEAWLLSQNTKEVEIESDDGLKLVGHYLSTKGAKRTLLMMHGWRAGWASDFGDMAKEFYKLDCNMLIVEERAQGASEGTYMGFGVLERYDCINWLNYINKQYGTELPIYLVGISMGAATVLMASELELPDNVKGIIADCGYSSPYEIVKIVAKKNFKLSEHAVKCIDKRCKKKADYSLKDASAKEALKHCRVPVFFAHGKSDSFVPYSMTEQDYEACVSRKTVFYVEEAEHARSFILATEEYLKRVKEFFEW